MKVVPHFIEGDAQIIIFNMFVKCLCIKGTLKAFDDFKNKQQNYTK